MATQAEPTPAPPEPGPEPEPEPEPRPPTASPPASARPAFIALLVAGAVGAAALPLTRLGIGWPICALAVLAIAVLAPGRAGAAGAAGVDRPVPAPASVDLVWRGAIGLAGLFLISVAGWRAAGWLVAVCLIAGVLLTSYALAGGRGWVGIIAGAVALLPATVQGLGWAADGARAGTDSRRGGQSVARALAGVAAGVILIVIFGSLFRAADPAFDALVARWTGTISVSTLARAAFGGLILVTVAVGVAYLAGHPRPVQQYRTPVRTGLRALEWAVPLAMLDALFVAFVWVQVTVLFGGHEYVLAPGGPDYAVYARGGFVELAFVSALTLGVVALLAVLAGRTTRLELGLLRLLGGALCGLTLVVIASALTRLGLYADAYGFTATRILAYAAVVWLGLVFLLVMAAGVRLRAPWLAQATMAAAAAVLVGLVVVNPEAVMARSVLSRVDSPYAVDYPYLTRLSADAVDVLDRQPESGRSCMLRRLAYHLAAEEPWYAWNLARAHARDVLADRPLILDCSWPS